MGNGIGPPIVFDFSGVLDLCTQAWGLADDLETYGTARDTALVTALEDWRGPEATTMVQDVWPAEATNLATGVDLLRQGALAWAEQWREAQTAYNYREYSIAVEQEKSTRSTAESLWDGFIGQDDSAKHVPEPAASQSPVPPGFDAPTGFVRYTQNGHSDWTASYRTSVAGGGGGGGGGSRAL